MSHQDIVRYPQSRGPGAGNGQQSAADDIWMQQQALSVAGAPAPQMMAHGGNGGGGNEVQPLQMVHRSLRGRYKLAILLAAIGAVVGTAVGWTQNEKVFRAKGTIRSDPSRVVLAGPAETQLEYTRFMGSEATYMKSAEFVRRVMARPEWKNTPAAASWDEASFIARLTTVYGSALSDINVSFDHPDRNVAMAAVQATLKAYEDYRTEQRNMVNEQGVDYWQGKLDETNQKLADLRQRKIEIQRDDANGDIETSITSDSQRRAIFSARLQDAKFRLQEMQDLKAAAATTPPHFTPEQLAPGEPLIARLLQDRDTQREELTRIERLYGLNAPAVRNLRDLLDNIDQRIDQIAAGFSKDLYGVIQDSTTPGANGAVANGSAANGTVFVRDETMADQERKVALAKRQFDEVAKDVAVSTNVRANLAMIDNDIKTNDDRLKFAQDNLAAAQAKSITVGANVRTFPNPLVDVAEDKRPTMATFGFAAGGALPLLGLVAYGMFDRKYRYSDETTHGGGTRGVPLLGILPNLPDRLSDPSQASVAAHCVHQIRTMLQLNVLGEGPSVLSVTSATSGDGKTSLSLALGLSFAASGSRTLLIDTDLIGAGLSSRLGIREPHGVGEAIASRDPMSYVRDTDVAGLSVLPVGTEGGQNASSFSPSAVRRLVAQVREQFDIVLIDTGPVLGSIEATPVVAASDAVILTVARGQNRDLVEKAIGHLRAIGARIAGVVFNRANAKDFERSISGISLRSVSRASSMNGSTNGSSHTSTNGERQDKRLGPLVHSVRGTREDTH